MSRRTRTVRTGVLEIAYEEHGPATGTPVLLLHGFPDDVRAYDGVVGPLVDGGARVVTPYLRGYGPTRFLDPAARRTAQQAAIGTDVLDLLDALDIERAVLAGYDWGGRAACIAAVLAPERVTGLVTIGGYNIQNTRALPDVAAVGQLRAHWYQWFFSTEQGRRGLEERRHEICRALWAEWSPSWQIDDADFAATATSFDNPDFVAVVLHSYRHRWGHTPGEPRFTEVEERLADGPPITVPSVLLHGGDDTVAPPERSAGDLPRFPSARRRTVVPGVGHFLPREAPAVVVDAVSELLPTRRQPLRPHAGR